MRRVFSVSCSTGIAERPSRSGGVSSIGCCTAMQTTYSKTLKLSPVWSM